MDKRRKISTFLAIVLSALLGYLVYQQLAPQDKKEPGNYQAITAAVNDPKSKLKELKVVKTESVALFYADKKKVESKYPDERSLTNLISAADKRNLKIVVESPKGAGVLSRVIPQILSTLLFIGLFILVLRMAGGGAGFGNLFGGKRFEANQHDELQITFDNVAGLGEAREEVKEIVDFLRDPGRFSRLGAKVPRGVLFVGQPGTGKTLLAKAVAGESEASFFSLTGSDFVEMFAGLGANRVRSLFKSARENQPSIVFIDEIDAVGRARGGSGLPGNDEREQTLNQLLSEMDGFAPNSAVVVIAATNRPDVLDAALLRPGRFDRQIHIDPPDRDGRLEILKVHSKDKPIASELLPDLANQTPGFTGAELANLLNEAAIIAARSSKDHIDAKDLDSALMRVVAGLESKRLLTEEEKSRIAYHEVGHALCAHFTEHRTPVHKISAVSRGRALGFTLSIPEQDRMLETKDSLMDRLCMLLGGRAAELHIFGSASSGASNDLERATELATQMVTQMGMSDSIGLRTIPAEGHGFVPGSVQPGMLHCSPATAQAVEEEVAGLIGQAQDSALQLIREHDHDLQIVTAALQEHETLHGDQFLELLGEKE